MLADLFSRIATLIMSIDEKIQLFKKSVFEFQKKIGFTDVVIYVDEQESDITRATWYADSDGHLVSIHYTKSWIEDPSTMADEIVQVAFHEVFESQFYKISKALDKLYSDSYIEQLRHELVRRAENFILPLFLSKNSNWQFTFPWEVV